jgi:hypothetical protein
MRRSALAATTGGEQDGTVGGAGGRVTRVGERPGGEGGVDGGAGVGPEGALVGAEQIGGPGEEGGEVGVKEGVGELGLQLEEVVGEDEGAGGEGGVVTGGGEALAVEADAPEVADDEAAQAPARVHDEGVLQVELEGDAVDRAQAEGGGDQELDVVAQRGLGGGVGGGDRAQQGGALVAVEEGRVVGEGWSLGQVFRDRRGWSLGQVLGGRLELAGVAGPALAEGGADPYGGVGEAGGAGEGLCGDGEVVADDRAELAGVGAEAAEGVRVEAGGGGLELELQAAEVGVGGEERDGRRAPRRGPLRLLIGETWRRALVVWRSAASLRWRSAIATVRRLRRARAGSGGRVVGRIAVPQRVGSRLREATALEGVDGEAQPAGGRGREEVGEQGGEVVAGVGEGGVDVNGVDRRGGEGLGGVTQDLVQVQAEAGLAHRVPRVADDHEVLGVERGVPGGGGEAGADAELGDGAGDRKVEDAVGELVREAGVGGLGEAEVEGGEQSVRVLEGGRASGVEVGLVEAERAAAAQRERERGGAGAEGVAVGGGEVLAGEGEGEAGGDVAGGEGPGGAQGGGRERGEAGEGAREGGGGPGVEAGLVAGRERGAVAGGMRMSGGTGRGVRRDRSRERAWVS